jgi:DNA-directed RNA polymerase subunit RPC12/RpoP
MRCATCGRFRAYHDDDRYCIVCGATPLESACACGRSFDYVLAEADHGELHCPRCGTRVRGRAADYE